MQKIWYKIKSKLLTIFGDIKVFKYPMFLIYSPKGFDIKGEDIEDIINLVDDNNTYIILRSYNNYLDGFFIPTGESKCTHSGVYSHGRVYHSIAEGVRKDSIIEFCKADRIVVLKPIKITDKQQKYVYEHAEKSVSKPYDFDFKDKGKGSNLSYYCHEFTVSCFPKTWDIKRLRTSNKIGIKGPEVFVADSFYLSDHFEVVYEK